MDHDDLEPIERLIHALQDDEVSFEDAMWFVERLAATSDVQFFLHSLRTGITRPMDPELATGRAAFHTVFEVSAVVFAEEFEPFGGYWPRPTLSRLLDWVDDWRSGHGDLGSIATRAEADSDGETAPDDADDETAPFETVPFEHVLRELCGQPEGDFVVPTPVYMVTLRSSDLELAATRALYWGAKLRAAVSGESPADDEPIETTQPEPTAVERGASLTTKEVARMVHRAEHTLRLWRMKGDGPPFHKLTAGRSGGVYYLRDEVEAWLRLDR